MAMRRQEKQEFEDGGVPVWSGNPADLDDSEEEATLYVETLSEKLRMKAGPRMPRAHHRDSPMRKLAMAIGIERLNSGEGWKLIVLAFRLPLQTRRRSMYGEMFASTCTTQIGSAARACQNTSSKRTS